MIFITILAMLILGLLLGYREVQILCDRLSWRWDDYKKHLYWFTNQNDKKVSNKDSFHISNGVVVTIISLSFAVNIVLLLGLMWWWIPILTVVNWLFIFRVRNVAMHIVFKKKPIWAYLWKI